MGVKLITEPYLMKSSDEEDPNTFVPLERELFLDWTQSPPKVRMGDGSTPGGVLVSGEGIANVAQPTILSPLNGATEVVTDPSVTSSTFNGTDENNDPISHVNTDWQIATVSNFSTTVYESLADTSNLTSLDLNALGQTLAGGTVHYVRVRYRGTGDVLSEWSTIVSFTTAQTSTELFFDGSFDSKFNDPTSSANQNYGRAICISSNGLFAAAVRTVAPREIDIYAYSGGNWTLTGNISPGITDLSGTDGKLAISNDGTRVACGTTGQNAYVFHRSNAGTSTWTTVQFDGSSFSVNPGSVSSVAMSGDGSRVFFGYSDATINSLAQVGMAYSVEWIGSTYQVADSFLPASITALGGMFFALSCNDSGTALVACNTTGIGAPDLSVQKWSYSGGSFSSAEVVYTESNPGTGCGQTIAVSDDGLIISVGAGASAAEITFVYEWNGSNWTDLRYTFDRGSHSLHTGVRHDMNAAGDLILLGNGANIDDPVLAYRKISGTWTLVFSKTMDASDDSSARIALSRDGQWAIIGTFNDTANVGSIHFYRMLTANASDIVVDGTLTQTIDSHLQQGNEYFGSTVRLSGDGNVAFVSFGATNQGNYPIQVFTKDSGGVWQRRNEITTSNANTSRVGRYLAVSYDGRAVAAGCYNHATDVGVVICWRLTGDFETGTWSSTNSHSPVTGNGASSYGQRIAMSGDGNWVIASASGITFGGVPLTGRVWCYKWNGGNYAEHSIIDPPSFTASGSIGPENGRSVAINGDGTVLVIGAPRHAQQAGGSIYTGAVHRYHLVSDAWQHITLVTGTVGETTFGEGLDISADGSTIIVGEVGYDDNLSGRVDNGRIEVFSFNGTNMVSEFEWSSGGLDHIDTGLSVAINGTGDVIAFCSQSDQGSVVYLMSGINFGTVVEINGIAENTLNTYLISISDDGSTFIVGDGEYDAQAGAILNTGRAYIYS